MIKIVLDHHFRNISRSATKMAYNFKMTKALLPSVLAKTGAPQNRLREFNKANDILAQRKQALEASRAFGLAVGITYLNELGKDLLRMDLGQPAEESTD